MPIFNTLFFFYYSDVISLSEVSVAIGDLKRFSDDEETTRKVEKVKF